MSFKESIATFYPISSDVNIDDYVDGKTVPPPCIVRKIKEFPSVTWVNCIIGVHLYYKVGVNYYIILNAYDPNEEKVSIISEGMNMPHKFFDITYNDNIVSYFLNSYIEKLEIKSSGVYRLVATLYSGDISDHPDDKVKLSESSSYLNIINGDENNE
ncbi:hypothetical protein AB7340_20300 [Providencia alcalifaciens]